MILETTNREYSLSFMSGVDNLLHPAGHIGVFEEVGGLHLSKCPQYVYHSIYKIMARRTKVYCAIKVSRVKLI